MNQHYLQLYADFIVKVGVNVRPRQNFIVRCPVTMPDFAHACVRAGYPTNIRGGSAMTRDDLMKKGLNNSAIHEDVMVGAADTHVTGITKRGEEVTIFENGEWAF